jgi:hypothetical protein
MVRIPAVLADFMVSRIVNGDLRNPAEPEIGRKLTRPREVVKDGDAAMPSADLIWVIPIPPHSIAKGSL